MVVVEADEGLEGPAAGTLEGRSDGPIPVRFRLLCIRKRSQRETSFPKILKNTVPGETVKPFWMFGEESYYKNFHILFYIC